MLDIMSLSAPQNIIQRKLEICNNPQCYFTFRIGVIVPQKKCGRCKSARYCNKNCQTQHWPAHKNICKVWSTFSKSQDPWISVEDVKSKTMQLIWLLRGMPHYTEHLFKEYRWQKGHGGERARGFMELHFQHVGQLLRAVSIIESYPVYEEADFRGMPGSPSGSFDPQKIGLRNVPTDREGEFMLGIEDKCRFSTNEDRPSLQKALNRVGSSMDVLLLSVCVELGIDDYNTNMYDLLYPNLSYPDNET